MGRRIVLPLLGAYLAAAGLTACVAWPNETTAPDIDSSVVTVASTAVTVTEEPTATPAVPTPVATGGQATQAPADEHIPSDESPAPTGETPGNGLEALTIALEPVARGLEVPVAMGVASDGSGRLFVLEKAGTIRIVQDGEVLPVPFLDITDRVGSISTEQGLLGIAFHPAYTENGTFFVNYTDRQGDTVISRFLVSGDPDQADPDSEVLVLAVDQPAVNHNGGHLAFGPDGYLYVGLGDGGGGGDTYGNGQNTGSLLGSMLRIDVSELPYTIPPDNPFVGEPTVLPEIWAYGLRNPWRYAFDRVTGDLYIADVGQNIYEEVNVQPADSPGGENYGWPVMEGLHCFPATQACDPTGLVQPVAEYDHAQANCSVTGGTVYRGQAFPKLVGVYFFGDFCSGRIWGMARLADGNWAATELLQQNINIASFGEDEAGELYVVDMRGGAVYHLVAR